MTKRAAKTERFSVDDMMLNTAKCLLRDFRGNLDDPSFCCDLSTALGTKDLAKIRSVAPAVDCNSEVALYKATYQMQSIFKRYRFEKDLYSDAELLQMALTGYKETQLRLSNVSLESLDKQYQEILDLAAQYVAQVLGPYDDEEHRRLCRFGRRASVGIPARSACEGARWQIPISGSQSQIDWFDAEMRHIAPVQNYLAKQLESDPNGSIYQPTDFLRLTLVPKTFKSFRAIMPNTTIGTYMSFGLGEMMRKRLQRKGYDIRSLQMEHRSLACHASITRKMVTADLSSASDSITTHLVERLFPSDWVKVLDLSRIGKVLLPDNSVVQSLTHCTMGIGYTFPLQTLVFLSLLKAIQATLRYRPSDPHRISVYGDDMIYPSYMHKRVLEVFEKVGFVINVDKTFDDSNFRESCGGDYFRGVDVRPFQPRNGSATVGRKAYEAVLYKYINGLLMRWSEYEIKSTLEYLLSELEALVHVAKVVPNNFPDDSGIRCPSLSHWEFLPAERRAKPKHVGHGVFRFSFLRLQPDEQKETRHEPYLWLALRCPPSHDIYLGSEDRRGHHSSRVQRIVEIAACVRPVVSPLITRADGPNQTIRSKLTGRRLRRTSTFVTVSHSGRYTRQSGTSCFDDRS